MLDISRTCFALNRGQRTQYDFCNIELCFFQKLSLICLTNVVPHDLKISITNWSENKYRVTNAYNYMKYQCICIWC